MGPVYLAEEYEERAELLASCYRESLRVAAGLGATTVAFPAVSAGVYGWPLDDAARIALGTVKAESESGLEQSVEQGSEQGVQMEEVRFVLFGAESYAAFERALRVLDQQG